MSNTRKIVITGSHGFIGTNLAMKLSKIKDISLIGVDSCISGSNNKMYTDHFMKHYQFCLTNINQLKNVLEGAHIVIHLAAKGNVIDSLKDPISNLHSNVTSTVCLLEAMRISGVRNIIFSSTGGALMGNTKPPVNEESLPSPISPYGASKNACEGYLSSYAESYNFNSIILRFGNVYGKYSSHKIGVINQWIRRVIQGIDLEIYGDGSSTRDYIHVDDICQGIYLASERLREKSTHGILEKYHLANNQEISLNQILNHLKKISDKPISSKYYPTRKGEVYRNSSENKLARDKLGFIPKVAFGEGVKQLYNWIKNEEFDLG
ncbi:epimerase [bacterium]|nr:epimerase [bacterium]|tara:strand:+ start:1497 stop:2459 length:963 start_codon:yes stop_codon:yes gene_type:complete